MTLKEIMNNFEISLSGLMVDQPEGTKTLLLQQNIKDAYLTSVEEIIIMAHAKKMEAIAKPCVINGDLDKIEFVKGNN